MPKALNSQNIGKTTHLDHLITHSLEGEGGKGLPFPKNDPSRPPNYRIEQRLQYSYVPILMEFPTLQPFSNIQHKKLSHKYPNPSA